MNKTGPGGWRRKTAGLLRELTRPAALSDAGVMVQTLDFCLEALGIVQRRLEIHRVISERQPDGGLVIKVATARGGEPELYITIDGASGEVTRMGTIGDRPPGTAR